MRCGPGLSYGWTVRCAAVCWCGRRGSVWRRARLLALLRFWRVFRARGYGLLLGSFGLGALLGAAAAAAAAGRLSVDGLGGVCDLFIRGHGFSPRGGCKLWLVNLVLFVSGVAWIGILALLNVAAQTMSAATNAGAGSLMYIFGVAGRPWRVGKRVWGSAGHESWGSDDDVVFRRRTVARIAYGEVGSGLPRRSWNWRPRWSGISWGIDLSKNYF